MNDKRQDQTRDRAVALWFALLTCTNVGIFPLHANAEQTMNLEKVEHYVNQAMTYLVRFIMARNEME